MTPNVFNAKCASREVIDLIADKWAAFIIDLLSRGTKRHSDLRRHIDGVPQKMLTQTVRGLERNGLVQRKVYPVVPPRADYSLTPLGATLVAPLAALCMWAESHLHEVEAARARYARSASRSGAGAEAR
jgi:DNA-binding HxlR family transcriptional regulator